jgi:hypothetical protein
MEKQNIIDILNGYSKDGYEFKVLDVDYDGEYPSILLEAINDCDSMKYEIWRIRTTTKEYVFPNGSVVPAGSLMKPGNEDFGTYAFSLYTLERAKSELKNVVKYGATNPIARGLI